MTKGAPIGSKCCKCKRVIGQRYPRDAKGQIFSGMSYGENIYTPCGNLSTKSRTEWTTVIPHEWTLWFPAEGWTYRDPKTGKKWTVCQWCEVAASAKLLDGRSGGER